MQSEGASKTPSGALRGLRVSESWAALEADAINAMDAMDAVSRARAKLGRGHGFKSREISKNRVSLSLVRGPIKAQTQRRSNRSVIGKERLHVKAADAELL